MRNGENRMLRATNTGLTALERVRDKTLPFELSNAGCLEALTELPYNIASRCMHFEGC